MAKVLSIIAPQGFQEIEYGDSKVALEAAGHQVITACREPMATDKQGRPQKVDILLKDAKPEDYDAILFVGGPGSYTYFDDPVAHKLAKAFYEAGKLTTAICAAPSILANAGLLKGKRATCFPSQTDHIKSQGAIHTGKAVEIDELLITADGPKNAKAFGEAIAQALN